MRVLFVTSERGSRGGERQVLLLGRELAAAGVEVGLCARPGAAVLEGFARSWTCGMANALDPRGFLGVRRAARELGAELVHAFTARAHALSLLSGRPLVVTRAVAFRAAKGLGGRAKYARAARYVAISSAAALRLEQAGVPRDRIDVVLPALEPPAGDRRSARERLGLADGSCAVGFLGALENEKGVADLIDAVAAVARPLTLLVIGEGSLRADLERRAASRLGNRVRFLGARDDARELLAGLDLYVQPSLDEGFGLAAAEAMACGVPVVASRTGGLVELLDGGRNGLLARPADPADLARQIEAALADPPAARGRCELARDFVLTRLEPRTQARGLVAVYRKVLGCGS